MIMNKFSVGDIIQKKYDENNIEYKILSLRIKNGGNWHDGYDESLIAVVEVNTYCCLYETKDVLLAHRILGTKPMYYYEKQSLQTFFNEK